MSNHEGRQAIAIVGMACRMPGADNLDEYWDLIRKSGQAFGPLPADRLDRELLLHPEKGKLCKTYTDLGGLVSDRPFDRQKNPISDELFEQLDQSHKIMLEVAADACRDAGYDPYNLAERRAGVYIGHTGGSERVSDLIYSTVVEEGAHVLDDVKSFTALGPQSGEYLQQMIDETRQHYPGRPAGFDPKLSALQASGLISEVFGLNGPFMVADAACASSMQSMAAGIRALREGRIEMAFAGGGSYCTSDTLVLFSSAQSVSATGSCPFSTQADGLVAAAGFVILILKTLDRAIADKDRIHAVISGFGVSSDGRGRSLWAPRKEGQILAVQRAYGENDLDPRRVQYIEAHATSTQVGDATEMQALSESISSMIGASAPKIPIGSVKGNIGHTLETAGMAGIVKTVLALKHKTIPPAIKGDELNSEINWDDCPFHVPFSPQPWPEHADGHPRRAAVNAFGIGGLNVHVVLDEFHPQQPAVRRLPSAKPNNDVNNKSTNPDDHAIAIIGMGCIVPGAKTLQAFWDLLMSERDALVEAPRDRLRSDLSLSTKHATWKAVGNYGGFITDYVYDWRKHKVAPKQVANANPLQFMLLDAADQALKNAGLNEQNMDTLHTAVVVGTTFGGDFCNQIQMGLRVPEFQRDLAKLLRRNGVPDDKIAAVTAEFHDRLFEKMPAMMDETGSFTSSTLASRITKTFNFMGGAVAIDAGTCSSLLSIQTAVDMLRQNDANVVVCASGQRSMDVWVYESLSNAGMLASGKPGAPFSNEANGYVPSEGCGVIVLKRLADARRDGNPIQAVIRGIGAATNDNYQQALADAAAEALNDADIPAGAVEAVEMHGMGIARYDQFEMEAIRQIYAAPEVGRKQPLQLGALRSQIGDMGGATGVVSVIKAARAAVEGILPATVGFTKLSPAMGDGRVATLSARGEKIPAFNADGYRAVAVTNINERMAYQLILDNGQPKPANVPVPQPAKVQPAKPVAAPLNAVTPVATSPALADLLSLAPQLTVHRYASSSRDGLLEQITAEKSGQASTIEGAYRLNLVAGSPEELTKKLRFAAEALRTDNWKLATEQGIFFGDPTRSKPRVAFMFPGQGSQYPGMFELLAQNFAPAGEALREANVRMREQGYPTFAELAGPGATGLGSDIWETQISLLLAQHIAFRMINSLGVKPDYFAGHSFGELPALLASGVWSLPSAIHATRIRCDAVIACKTGPSAMVSMLANRETATRILKEIGADIWLCAENSLEQCVVGGREAGVDRFFDYCKTNRITVKKLKVPFAYHTPLLEPTREQLRVALDIRDMDLPTAPFLSSTYCRFLADPVDFRDSLVDQMTHPVEYVGVVQKLRARGVDTFLEIGPSQVLTQLTRKILLTDPAVRCLSIDQGDPKTPEALIRMIVALETWGLLGQSPAASVAVATATAVATSAVTAAREKPAPKFVDATETRRARMRSGSRGVAAAKPEPKTPAQEQAVAVAESKSNFGHPVERRVANAAATNGASRFGQHSNGHADHHGNGHGTIGHSNGHSNDHHGNGHHREEPVKSAVPAPLPENWSETLAWLQNQARVHGLRGELATQLDKPWASLDMAAEPFVSMLHDFYELSDADRQLLKRLPTVAELCLFLCDKPGKSAWLPEVPEANNSTSSAEQAKFLVEFVVDQTGYPADMVDLDADLEADLGIDSIKKAQLFGEIGEKYSLSVDPNMSLDDFPTLRHLLGYIEKSQGRNSGSAPTGPAKPGPTAAKPSATSSVSVTAALKTPTQRTSPASSPETISVSNSATALLEAPAAAPDKADPATDESAEIEAHLINFVIEQTGYPEDMVDLDANLEADLGIDSIKKAQLFGEIGERFSLTADPNQSLDDYPTLRHILAYMLKSRGAAVSSPTPAAPAAKPAPVVQPAPAPQSVAPVVAPVASAAVPAAPQNKQQDHAKLAAFLVEFVVEQTGYPEDMVDLDASLEADLGIDSIKKAQLFGEIGERFQLTADANQSLDDYPTLRHVLQFMINQLGGTAEATTSPAPAALKKNDAPAVPPAVAPAMPDTNLAQASFNEGFRRGQTAQQAIRMAVHRRTQSAAATTVAQGQAVALAKLLSDAEFAELQGLADGAGILVETLQALNFASDALMGTEADLSFDAADAAFVLRGLVTGETAPVLVKKITAENQACYEWIVPGYLGCIAGVSQHGLAVAAEYPSTITGSNQLPAAIVAERVLQNCRDLAQARELLTSQRWTPGASITIADLAGNQLLRWTADGNGEPQAAAAASLPLSSSAQVVTPSALRQIEKTTAVSSAVSGAHWLRLSVNGNVAQQHTGDQWQTAATLENQKSETLPFAIPQPTIKRSTAPAVRELPPIQFPAGPLITQRYLPRLILSQRSSTAQFATGVKTVAILGQQPVTAALAAMLQSEGCEVAVFAESLSLAESTARLDKLGPCHLILAATNEFNGTTSTQWSQQSGTLSTAFAVCQHWLAQQQLAGMLDQVSLAALTSLGGSLGFAPEIVNPLGGGLTGFCKGLRNEYPQLRVKLIDSLALASPAETARVLGAEWSSADTELEVALRGNQRYVVRYSEPALPPRCETLPQVGDQWIVTGGARGITAVVAREMAARYGLHLNILGSTDLSDLDDRWLTATEAELKEHKSVIMKAAKARGVDAMGAWKDFEKTLEIARNLQLLHDAGLDAHYFVCDVSDWKTVKATLAAIRSRGPIRGIMHGAGYEAAAKFEKKKLPQVEKTIQVKAGGAAALMALTAHDPLGWFIGFGSTSGRFGGVGQTDYSLANDLLAKQTSWLRETRPDCRTVTVHWHAWGEIGMAARPESKFALEAFGLKMMPPAEGIAYLLTEIDAGLPEREIVITEGRFIPETLMAKESDIAPPANAAPQAASVASEAAGQTSGISEAELQTVMINFVVEQTGYPEDMIDFDAALEADLGIDSIKKAQLFGEIGERYGLTVDPNLSLDDFPTLRHLQRYVLEQKNGAAVSAPVNKPVVAQPAAAVAPAVAAPKLFLGPMLSEVKFLDAQRHQAIAKFDPVADVFLTDHRLNGRPLLPGTFGWDLLAQAAAALEPGKTAVRLTNINIMNPLGFADDSPRTVGVNCERVGNRWRTESMTLDENRPLMTGEVEFFAEPPASEVTFEPNKFPMNPMRYQDKESVYHGMSMRTCLDLMFQHGGGWGKLRNFGHQATAGNRHLDGWILPAGLLDGAIVGCAVFDYLMCGGRVEVPHGIDELTLFQAPRADETCLMQFRFREIKDRNSWFDFDLFGEGDRLLATARGLRLVTLE